MDERKRAFLIVLGQNIKNVRESQNMSMDELAKKCGYDSDNSRSTIQKIESGKNDVPASKLKEIANALGVSVSDLMKNSAEIQQQILVCDLFEQCYGKEPFITVQKFMKLDFIDQTIINSTIDTLLKAEKYSSQEESKNA